MTRFGLAEARRFYDRFGARQDRQTWYERPALERLIRQARFADASAVVELGCGTGAFAARLLEASLPAAASYRGFDLSATMVELARRRLASFTDRASVERVGGEPPLPLAAESCDRFVASYVFDLLPPRLIAGFVAEARRLLVPTGKLGLVGLTPGATFGARLVMGLWSAVHRISPKAVGGCRPLVATDFLAAERWRVLHRSIVVARGVASEVVVAEPRIRLAAQA